LPHEAELITRINGNQMKKNKITKGQPGEIENFE
jgi:hypothetical protein